MPHDHPLSRACENIEREYLGNRAAVELLLVGLLAEGHVLIEDIPGIGKTSLALALARTFSLSFKRIQFTSDLFPSDIVGTVMYDREFKHYQTHKGPIFANIVLADEINRAAPKTQSALLEAMAERRVTLDRETHELPSPFFVVATQNPLEFYGTFPLPEAQLDRFLLTINLGYPDEETERRILREKRTPFADTKVTAVVDAREFDALRAQVTAVRVDAEIERYITAISRATREHSDIALGASVRGTLSLFRAAQALAVVRRREYTIPDDVKELAPAVFAHRIILKKTAQNRGFSAARRLIELLLDDIPVPV